jgi:hypothetical protein
MNFALHRVTESNQGLKQCFKLSKNPFQLHMHFVSLYNIAIDVFQLLICS